MVDRPAVATVVVAASAGICGGGCALVACAVAVAIRADSVRHGGRAFGAMIKVRRNASRNVTGKDGRGAV